MSGENVMTREMAEDEFARFLEAMDLDAKVAEKADAEDTKALDRVRNIVIRAIENGSFVIGDNGEGVFTPRRGTSREPITFGEPDGGAILASDKRRDGHNTAKTYAMLAHWTGQNPDRFAKLKRSDVEFCTSVMALFFG